MYQDDTSNWDRRAVSANWYPFGNIWKPGQISFSPENSGIMTLALEQCQAGEDCWGLSTKSGEYRSKAFFGPGNKFEARFKAAKGEGIINGFFTFSWNPHH